MEPPKVEVSMSGCIMVPTASPQARGVPISTYEGPLVSTMVIICYIYYYFKSYKNITIICTVYLLIHAYFNFDLN